MNKKAIAWLLKVAIFLLLCWSIYEQVWNRTDRAEVMAEFWNRFQWQNSGWLVLAFGLMLLSWAIEAIKWRFLISKIEGLSFWVAFKAILSGLTFSLFTPNRIGEFGGRVLLLRKANKIEGAAITLVGSLSQIVASIILSFSGFILFYYHYMPLDFYSGLLISIGILLSIILVLVFFNVKHAQLLFEKVRWLRKYAHYLTNAVGYSKTELTAVLSLSGLRYFIFSLEYLILLWFFGVEISAIAGFALVCCIFFIQTIVPSIALVELGIRGKVALYFAGFLALNEIGVLTASFLLWTINLLIPALIGWVIISRINLHEAIFDK